MPYGQGVPALSRDLNPLPHLDLGPVGLRELMADLRDVCLPHELAAVPLRVRLPVAEMLLHEVPAVVHDVVSALQLVRAGGTTHGCEDDDEAAEVRSCHSSTSNLLIFFSGCD